MALDFLTSWVTECAQSLICPLGERWQHVQGVVTRARAIAPALDDQDRWFLIAAAYVHDIGYSPALAQTGFHPLDGARYLRSQGHERLASLVAYHSEAQIEAELRGYARALAQFHREKSPVADALTYCDILTDSAGSPVTLAQRRADILARYGANHVTWKATSIAMPYICLAIARTTKRLKQARIISPSPDAANDSRPPAAK